MKKSLKIKTLILYLCNGLHIKNVDITVKKTLAKIKIKKYNMYMKEVVSVFKEVRSVVQRVELE